MPPTPPSIHALQVLHLEDSPGDAALIRRRLQQSVEQLDHRAVDTREAFLDLLHEQPWDIVLSDCHLPGFDGYSALRLVRRERPEIPCLMVSGTFDAPLREACLKAGAAACIDKDHLEDLLPAIQQALPPGAHPVDRGEPADGLDPLSAQGLMAFRADPTLRRFVEISPLCHERTGYPAEAWTAPDFTERVRLDPLPELPPAESALFPHAALDRLWAPPADAPRPDTFLCPLAQPDAPPLWVQITASPPGPNGLIQGWVTDVSRRIHAEQARLYLSQGLSRILQAIETLHACESDQELHRRAVELARETLGLDRARLLLLAGEKLQGTFGTNARGAVVPESALREALQPTWHACLKPSPGELRWHTLFERRTAWEEGNPVSLGEGWMALTPLCTGRGEPLGVFVNDSALTGAPLKPLQQTLLADYCRHLSVLLELRRSNARVQATDRRYRSLVEQLPTITYQLRPGPESDLLGASSILFVSPQVEEILGDSPEDWRTAPGFWIQRILPEDLESVREAFARAVRDGRPVHVTYRTRAGDGRVVWIENRALPSPGDAEDRHLFQGVMMDVTTLRATQQSLERREAILEASSWIADLLLRSASWKDTIQETLARVGSATRASRVYLLERLGPEPEEADHALRLRLIHEWTDQGIATTRNAPQVEDFSFRAVDAPHWERHLLRGYSVGGLVENSPPKLAALLRPHGILSFITVPIFVEKTLWGAIGVDDTRLGRRWSPAERDALQLVASLLSSAIQRQRDQETQTRLNQSLQRARRMEDMGHVAGGVAHDLNNILGPMVAYPDLVLSQLPEDSPVRQDLVEIRNSAQQASQVIQDLLSLARRERSETEPLSLNELLGEYLQSTHLRQLRQTAPDLRVVDEFGPDLPRILGSTPHLTRVLMNLVLNAAEATEPEGRIVLRTRRRHLEKPLQAFEAIPAGDYVLLSVEDDGRGIEPAARETIFDPFVTQKTLGRSGTGLGLTVVFGIVKDLGGFIDVQSTPGAGARFDLYFPALEEEAPVLATPSPAPLPAPGPGELHRILVVDDTALVREVFERFLTRLGYEVLLARQSEEALQRLRERPPDLVILDISLGEDLDGFAVAEEIQRIAPGMACLLTSGDPSEQRQAESDRLGHGPILAKPFTYDQLQHALHARMQMASPV